MVKVRKPAPSPKTTPAITIEYIDTVPDDVSLTHHDVYSMFVRLAKNITLCTQGHKEEEHSGFIIFDNDSRQRWRVRMNSKPQPTMKSPILGIGEQDTQDFMNNLIRARERGEF